MFYSGWMQNINILTYLFQTHVKLKNVCNMFIVSFGLRSIKEFFVSEIILHLTGKIYTVFHIKNPYFHTTSYFKLEQFDNNLNDFAVPEITHLTSQDETACIGKQNLLFSQDTSLLSISPSIRLHVPELAHVFCSPPLMGLPRPRSWVRGRINANWTAIARRWSHIKYVGGHAN